MWGQSKACPNGWYLRLREGPSFPSGGFGIANVLTAQKGSPCCTNAVEMMLPWDQILRVAMLCMNASLTARIAECSNNYRSQTINGNRSTPSRPACCDWSRTHCE